MPIDGFDFDLARWEAALHDGTFEEAYAALEEAVARLEQGQLPLEESLRCFELGTLLARRCEQMLDEAELRISRLEVLIERGPGARANELGEPDDDETGPALFGWVAHD